jgi:hypothetical protein
MWLAPEYRRDHQDEVAEATPDGEAPADLDATARSACQTITAENHTLATTERWQPHALAR